MNVEIPVRPPPSAGLVRRGWPGRMAGAKAPAARWRCGCFFLGVRRGYAFAAKRSREDRWHQRKGGRVRGVLDR
jgi:hypothetical protein